MSDKERFEEQLSSIESQPVLEKILSNGYWLVSIRPVEFASNRITSIPEIRSILKNCVVDLTGRTYPHTAGANETIGTDYIQGVIDWEEYSELSRFWQSAHFVHYMALREDYHYPDERLLKPYIALHTFTEVYEFASRLASNGVLVPGVEVKVTLHGANGRRLDGEGFFPKRDFTCNMGYFETCCVHPSETFMKARKQLAADACVQLLHRFGWTVGVLDDMQNEELRFLSKKR